MENPSSITQATKLAFAHHCIHVVNLIEMTIVPITEELRNDILLQPA